ncbi:MAG: TlpA family protein disulfide reductase [Phycisphaerae bacterium]|jgi:peroxiredoxin
MTQENNTNENTDEPQQTQKTGGISLPYAILIFAVAVLLGWMIMKRPLCSAGSEPVPAGGTETAATVDVSPLEGIVNADSLILKGYYGKPAPDMKLTDLRGKEFDMAACKGRNVIVVFWATWCPPCRAEVPELIELRAEHSPEELEIVGVSLEKADVVTDFMESNGMNYKVVATDKAALPEPFSMLRAYPTIFIVDKDGNFKAIFEGGYGKEVIESILSL